MERIRHTVQTYWQKWQAKQEKNQVRLETAKSMTRGDYRLSRKGRYEINQTTHRLTPAGKTTRLRHRLNITIIILGLLIIGCYIVLIYL